MDEISNLNKDIKTSLKGDDEEHTWSDSVIQLLNTSNIRLDHSNLFSFEADNATTNLRTPWHQDGGYWRVSRLVLLLDCRKR